MARLSHPSNARPHWPVFARQTRPGRSNPSAVLQESRLPAVETLSGNENPGGPAPGGSGYNRLIHATGAPARLAAPRADQEPENMSETRVNREPGHPASPPAATKRQARP